MFPSVILRTAHIVSSLSRRLLHRRKPASPPPAGSGKPYLTLPRRFRPQLGLGMSSSPLPSPPPLPQTRANLCLGGAGMTKPAIKFPMQFTDGFNSRSPSGLHEVRYCAVKFSTQAPVLPAITAKRTEVEWMDACQFRCPDHARSKTKRLNVPRSRICSLAHASFGS
ncbi:hypothetical protein VTI74DRAFT_10792 [Chaetomium olivicolor]